MGQPSSASPSQQLSQGEKYEILAVLGVVRLEKYEKSLGENYVGLGSLFLRDEECFSLYSDIGAIPSLTLRFFYPPLPKPWPIFSSAMVIFQFAELTQPRLGSKPSRQAPSSENH